MKRAAGIVMVLAIVGSPVLELSSSAGPQSPEPGSKRLHMCLATAADWSPIYPTTVFPANMRELHCAFHLNDNEKFQTLTSIWIAVDVGEAAPPNYEMARTDTAL